MTAPKTKEWSAWIDLMPVNKPTLHVTGQVETSASNVQPKLAEAEPQGINPSILILVLTLENSGGDGSTAFAFHEARYEKPAKKGQYTEVHIRFAKDVIQKISVTEAH